MIAAYNQHTFVAVTVDWLPGGSVSEFPGFSANFFSSGIVVCSDGVVDRGTRASPPGFPPRPIASATRQQLEDSDRVVRISFGSRRFRVTGHDPLGVSPGGRNLR